MTNWQPSWNTAPDKSKAPHAVLVATVAFVDQGFRGSPLPQTANERKQAQENQQKFIRAFRSSHECFGTTLTLQKPSKSDFGLQYFEGVDGRSDRYQWVLYRMDTLGAVAYGEATGVNTVMGLDSALKSICSSIHSAITYQGGSVEE